MSKNDNTQNNKNNSKETNMSKNENKVENNKKETTVETKNDAVVSEKTNNKKKNKAKEKAGKAWAEAFTLENTKYQVKERGLEGGKGLLNFGVSAGMLGLSSVLGKKYDNDYAEKKNPSFGDSMKGGLLIGTIFALTVAGLLYAFEGVHRIFRSITLSADDLKEARKRRLNREKERKLRKAKYQKEIDKINADHKKLMADLEEMTTKARKALEESDSKSA
jgi:hypothetical protein